MTEYPKVIYVRGISHVVTSERDHAFWRQGEAVSTPQTFTVSVTPKPRRVSKPPQVVKKPVTVAKAAPKPKAKPKQGTKKK